MVSMRTLNRYVLRMIIPAFLAAIVVFSLLLELIDLFFRLENHTVEIGEDLDVGHIDQTSRSQRLTAPPTVTFLHELLSSFGIRSLVTRH